MNWFWINMPLAAAFFGAGVGVPMWLVIKHPDQGPAPLAAQATTKAAPPAPAVPQTGVIPQPSEQLVGV
jgi:hypothetical protein